MTQCTQIKLKAIISKHVSIYVRYNNRFETAVYKTTMVLNI